MVNENSYLQSKCVALGEQGFPEISKIDPMNNQLVVSTTSIHQSTNHGRFDGSVRQIDCHRITKGPRGETWPLHVFEARGRAAIFTKPSTVRKHCINQMSPYRPGGFSERFQPPNSWWPLLDTLKSWQQLYPPAARLLAASHCLVVVVQHWAVQWRNQRFTERFVRNHVCRQQPVSAITPKQQQEQAVGG